MKRAIKWFLAVIAAIVGLGFLGDFALTEWIAHKKNEEAHSMHEGHIIVDEIRNRDPTIRATCSTADGNPEIVVRNEFDPRRQDMIIAWAKALKREGRVHRSITIEFHKEIPHSNVPDTLLRVVEF